MQIGIDVGATKIESVVLDENGNESNRDRTDCPKDYFQIIKTIKEIDKKLAKKFNKKFKKNLKTNQIFELYRKHDLDAEDLIDNFKLNLAMSLSNIINILDPDCFVFGGGVSNEIDFLSEIETIVRKFVTGREYEGVFLKPKYGDASGVRGAARLGRKSIY